MIICPQITQIRDKYCEYAQERLRNKSPCHKRCCLLETQCTAMVCRESIWLPESNVTDWNVFGSLVRLEKLHLALPPGDPTAAFTQVAKLASLRVNHPRTSYTS